MSLRNIPVFCPKLLSKLTCSLGLQRQYYLLTFTSAPLDRTYYTLHPQLKPVNMPKLMSICYSQLCEQQEIWYRSVYLGYC